MKALSATKTKLLVLLIVVAIVALTATVVLTTVNFAKAEEVNNREALVNRLSNAPSGTVLQLTNDIEIDDPITIARSGSVTLDLNGYMLRYNGMASSPVLTLTSGALTITSSMNAQAPATHSINYRGATVSISGGLITGGKDGGVLVTGGSLNLEGGTIAGNSTTKMDVGGGVTFKSSANNFNMSGNAAISYNTAQQGGGVYVLGLGSSRLIMDGGRIDNNTATINGGGVFLTGSQGILFEMKKGSVSNNTATNGKGGGIYVDNAITAIISGTAASATYDQTKTSRVNGNVAPSGAGIYLEKGTLQMSGGTVGSNNATSDGAGIYAKESTVDISGGEIIANATTYGNGAGLFLGNSSVTFSGATVRGNQISGYGNGAGVYLNDAGSTFAMSGGSIVGNNILSTGSGAGVYFAAGTFSVSGSPVINDNAVGVTANNLQLVGSQTFVTVTGAIGDSADVRVSVDSPRAITAGYKTAGNTVAKGFTSDVSTWNTVLTSGGEISFKARTAAMALNGRTNETSYFGTLEEAFTEINKSPLIPWTLTLQADAETSATLTVSVRELTLDLNGYMIRCTNLSHSVFTIAPTAVAASVNFTIQDSRPQAGPHEIDVSKVARNNPAVTSSSVKIYGGLITGGANGIYHNNATNSGSVNIDFRSGTIAGSDSTAVLLTGAGATTVMKMYSGSAVRYAGTNGVAIQGLMQFTMYGGDVSYNGTYGVASSWMEAGSSLQHYATIRMVDGRVTNNGQVGVYIGDGTCVIEGGDISYNGYRKELGLSDDSDVASGVNVIVADAILTMSGGTISHNYWEGIVTQQTQKDVSDPTKYMVTITGGEISYNGHEGVRLTNSYVNGSTSTGLGSIASSKANATISNATISYNHWTGVYGTATLNITDSTLANNGDRYQIDTDGNHIGNNVYLAANTNATFTNSKFYGGYYLGIFVQNSTLKMIGCEMSDGSVQCIGIYNGSSVTLDSTEIKNISGIWMRGGTLNVDNGTTIHDNGQAINIYAANNVTINLNNGSFYNCARNAINASLNASKAISVVVTMKDGFSIHDCGRADRNGGAVSLELNRDYATTEAQSVLFDMQGGEIYNNLAMYGGAVYVNCLSNYTYTNLSSTFKMSGGKIYDNTSIYGGAVYYGSSQATVQMSGNPYVLGNTNMHGEPRNVYLVGEQKINFTGEIGWDTTDLNKPETFKVGVTVESLYDKKVISSGYSTTSGYKNLFVKGFVLDTAPEGTSLGMDNNEIIVVFRDGAGLIAVGKWDPETKTFTEVSQHGTWAAAYAAVTSENNAIQLLADLGVSSMIIINKSVVLDLNGYMMQSGTGKYLDTLIQVNAAAANLTITDSTYVDGESTAEVTHWFQNPVTGEFEEVRGGVIHGKVAIPSGNVVFDAGYIINGRSSTVSDKIDNLVITVSLTSTGSFTMRDNAAICYNNGPAIYHDGGTTKIEGGKIFANSAVYGSALVITAPNAYMSGGEIYDNCSYAAKVNPKGIIHISGNGTSSANQSNGEFTMTGGSIHDNIVQDSNGFFSCVCVGSMNGIKAKFTMTGGSIVNNKVQGSNLYNTCAGGIMVYTNSTVAGSSSTLVLGGNAVVDGNTVEDKATNSTVVANVKLVNDSKIVVANNLSIDGQSYTGFTEGARIGVSLPSGANRYVFTDGYSKAGGMDNNIPFFADDPTNCMQFDMDGSLGKAGELILNAHVAGSLQVLSMTQANCATGEKGQPQRWYCEVCDRTFSSIAPFVEYDPERDDIVAEHQFTDYQFSTLYKHVARCTVCEETKELDHVVNEYVFNGLGGHTGLCSVCRADVTLACTYAGEENVRSSASSHWQECSTCGAHYDEKAHVVEPGTSRRIDATNHSGTCSICGFDGVVAPHNTEGVEFVFDPNNEDTQHYQLCPDCNTPVHVGEHALVTSEIEDDEGSFTLYECQVCNYSSKTAHHVVGGKMNFDASGHWYDCQLHPGEKLNVQDHKPIYVTSGGQHTITCEDECGYTLTENCTYRGYTFDEETATQGHYNVCSVCGKGADGEEKTYISHGRELHTDADKHWFECPDCGYVVDSGANHAWTWRSEGNSHWQYCASEECGITKSGTYGEHDFDGNWVTNGTDHWKVCADCAAISGQAQHQTTIISNGIDGHHVECTICRWNDVIVGHEWGDYRISESGHFRVCDDCYYSENEQAHAYDGTYQYIGSGQHSRTCTVCQRSISEECVNTYNVTDSTHTAECSRCHNVGAATPHKLAYTSNAGYHWQRCETCGYSNYETAKQEHNFDNASGLCATCGRPSADELASNRFDANFSIEEAALAAKAKLISEGKSVYAGLIDLALSNATAGIENALTAEEINEIVLKAIASFNENVLLDRAEYAKAQFDAKEAELTASLPDTLTAEERARYAEAITAAKAAAVAAVEGSTSLTVVDAETAAGIASMETAMVDVAKSIARAKVWQEATDKKAELNAMTDVSAEQKAALSRVIDKELARAYAEISAATSLDDASQAEARGVKVIRDIIANPDLAEDKSDGRDELEKEAQDKKDEIDRKVEAGELTPEEGEEQKKAVDEELKKAQDNVTDSKTDEEVKDAVDKGKDSVGEAAKPQPKPDDPTPGPGTDTPDDPAPGDDTPKANWFEENAVPVGIAGAVLGVMLLLIIILALAARKRKSK